MRDLHLNKSDYQLILSFFAFMTVWLLLKFWTERNPLGQILFDTPIIVLKTAVGFFAVSWIVQRYLVRKKQYLLGIILAVLAMIITGFVDMLRDYFGTGHTWSDLPDLGYMIMHSFYYSAADLSVPFVLVIGKKYYENQALLATSREKQKESELKLLRSQLSPHFLFNNLNTVDALIDVDPMSAKKCISTLSDLYRYLLSTQYDDVAPLRDEIKMVKNYFYLINTRFGPEYSFEIEGLSDNTNKYLLTGALQTLLANVIKHNKVVVGHPIKTILRISEDEITVSNNKGQATNTNDSFGVGLQNIKERYELLFGKHIQIEDLPASFTVKLPIICLTDSSV